MDVRVVLWRRLSAEELMLLNCSVGEDSWESLGQQGDPTPVHPKGDQSWVFIGMTDVEAETAILWPPDAKSWLIWKNPDAGKDWGQEEKGTTEDEMAGWHHWLNGRESEWTLGVGDGQGGLACCDSWGCRVRHDWATELNWTDRYRGFYFCLYFIVFIVFYNKMLFKINLWNKEYIYFFDQWSGQFAMMLGISVMFGESWIKNVLTNSKRL